MEDNKWDLIKTDTLKQRREKKKSQERENYNKSSISESARKPFDVH